MLLACLVVAGLADEAAAADRNPADATGTWKWTAANRTGQAIEMSLRLKQAGDKLTGVQIGRGGELPIQDGEIKEGKLSFKVVAEFGGNTVLSKYEGALKGDTIEGKTESNFGGENRIRDWIAKREAPKTKQALNAGGTWQWTFNTPAGQTFEPRLQLHQVADKLTGVVVWAESEMTILEGENDNGLISFNVVRERDGRTVTTKYRGKLSGDSIQGKIESDWGGDTQSFDWNAKRVSVQP